MTVLDLTAIPPVPSLFRDYSETLEFQPRRVIKFLRHVARQISKPVDADEKIHVHYVPTQVITEYVRSQLIWGMKSSMALCMEVP